MRNSLPLALLVLLTSSTLHAQSRFDGTWEMKMDTLQFSGPPEEYLLVKGTYHCETCVPKVDVETDGTDHKVTGHPYDTLAVRILDNHSVKFTMKKDGKTTFECVETVSSDDRLMKSSPIRRKRRRSPEKRDSLDSPKALQVRMRSRASGVCKPSRTRPAPAL